MKTSAVIYTRFSPRPSPEESRSLEVQESVCRSYCALRSLDVTHVIQDAEQSAHKTRLNERPGGKQLLDLIDTGVTNIVVQRMDRIFRSINGRDWMDRWAAAGVNLHLADQGGCSINCSTATGKFISTMLIAVGEIEAGLTGERTSSSMRLRQSTGQIMGTVPYGFKPDGTVNPDKSRNFVECVDEQFILRIIRQMNVEGHTSRETARWLNQNGMLTRKKRPWHHHTITKILARNGVRVRA